MSIGPGLQRLRDLRASRGESPGVRGQPTPSDLLDRLSDVLDEEGRLLDDEGQALLPPLRGWWFPEHGGYWTDFDVLMFWCISMPVADRDADSDFWAVVKRVRPQIDAAVRASRRLEAAEDALAKHQDDPACPAIAIEKLREHRDDAAQRRVDCFTPLLETGLRVRLGLALDMGLGVAGGGMHRIAFEWVRECAAAAMPPGLAVCESCSVVFEPRRKSYASRCDPCGHWKPGRRVPLAVARNEQRGYDLGGFGGELILRTGVCRECGETFECNRADRMFCTDRCRKRSERRSEGRAARSA